MLSKKLLARLLRKCPYLFTESEARSLCSSKGFDGDFAVLAAQISEGLVRLTSAVHIAKIGQVGYVDEKAQNVVDASMGNLSLDRLIEIQRTILLEKSFPFHAVFSLDFRGRDLLNLLVERYLDDLSNLQEVHQKQLRSSSDAKVQVPLSKHTDYLEFIATYFKSELRFAQPTQESKELSGDVQKKLFLVTKDRQKPLGLDPLVRQSSSHGLESFSGTGLGGVEYVPLVGGEPRWCVEANTIKAFLELFLKIGAYRQAVTLGEGGHTSKSNSPTIRYASHCYSGLEHMRRAKFHMAALEFDKALRMRDDIPLLHFHLGRAHEKLNNVNKGIYLIERLAERWPEIDQTHEVLGDLYRKKGDGERARKTYEQAVEKNPSNFRAREKLGALSRTTRKGEQKADKEEPKGTEAAQEGVHARELLVELTEEARHGRLPTAIGRDQEIEEIIEILSCQNRNNPLIVGEPGVGKTALVEELANRVVAGRVPEKLREHKIYLLSIATILAGAKFRGQFEERILGLIKELTQEKCILFIDDMHTMISSGISRGGSLDTASLFKPALIRGEIQAIGAAPYEEYRLNIEKETSLMRSFQIVNVEEPDWETVGLILEENITRFAEYHHVEFDEFDRLEVARLIKVCIKDRLLPDIAINVFDRAAAKVSLRSSAPEETEPSSRLVGRIDVIEVLSDISGVPVSKLARSQSERFMNIEEILAERVIGQNEAIEAVAKVIRTTKLNLDLNPQRPDGVFLFVGPSGVGKTELARSLSEFLFGDEEKLIRIDMSEYMEKISSSRLIGAAPGYVGYNDQNQLSDQVRKDPYSLVLLDEIEKADDQMINLFLQVFDAGRLTDGKGRTVHFNNTTIVMTSNLGTELFSRKPVGYSESEDEGMAKVSRSELMREIKRYFAPEFLNRIDEIVFFEPLSFECIKDITLLKLKELTLRLESQGIKLMVHDAVLEEVAREGYSPEFGARNLARVIRRKVLDPLASSALSLRWHDIRNIEILSLHPDFELRVTYYNEEGQADSVEMNEVHFQLSNDAEPDSRT